MKKPADWTLADWHRHTMKIAAMLDGMTVNEAHTLLDGVKNIVAVGTVFRLEGPEFQALVHQLVTDIDREG